MYSKNKPFVVQNVSVEMTDDGANAEINKSSASKME